MSDATLHHQVVLVTGGSRGIGAAAVRALHAAGADVFFTYATREREARELARSLGERVACGRLDLADAAALAAALDACIAKFGRIDVLVNNAGVFEPNPFDRDDLTAWRAAWQRTFAINLFSCADLSWLAIRHMRAQGGGRIINVVSRAAHRGEPDAPDYGASKAALVNLTKSIARACAPHGITSIAIAPGWVDTDMAARDLARAGDEIVAEIPLGRVGTPEEIAAAIVFAASPLAAYANGATIDLNGGSYVR